MPQRRSHGRRNLQPIQSPELHQHDSCIATETSECRTKKDQVENRSMKMPDVSSEGSFKVPKPPRRSNKQGFIPEKVPTRNSDLRLKTQSPLRDLTNTSDLELSNVETPTIPSSPESDSSMLDYRGMTSEWWRFLNESSYRSPYVSETPNRRPIKNVESGSARKVESRRRSSRESIVKKQSDESNMSCISFHSSSDSGSNNSMPVRVQLRPRKTLFDPTMFDPAIEEARLQNSHEVDIPNKNSDPSVVTDRMRRRAENNQSQCSSLEEGPISDFSDSTSFQSIYNRPLKLRKLRKKSFCPDIFDSALKTETREGTDMGNHNLPRRFKRTYLQDTVKGISLLPTSSNSQTELADVSSSSSSHSIYKKPSLELKRLQKKDIINQNMFDSVLKNDLNEGSDVGIENLPKNFKRTYLQDTVKGVSRFLSSSNSQTEHNLDLENVPLDFLDDACISSSDTRRHSKRENVKGRRTSRPVVASEAAESHLSGLDSLLASDEPGEPSLVSKRKMLQSKKVRKPTVDIFDQALASISKTHDVLRELIVTPHEESANKDTEDENSQLTRSKKFRSKNTADKMVFQDVLENETFQSKNSVASLDTLSTPGEISQNDNSLYSRKMLRQWKRTSVEQNAFESALHNMSRDLSLSRNKPASKNSASSKNLSQPKITENNEMSNLIAENDNAKNYVQGNGNLFPNPDELIKGGNAKTSSQDNCVINESEVEMSKNSEPIDLNAEMKVVNIAMLESQPKTNTSNARLSSERSLHNKSTSLISDIAHETPNRLANERKCAQLISKSSVITQQNNDSNNTSTKSTHLSSKQIQNLTDTLPNKDSLIKHVSPEITKLSTTYPSASNHATRKNMIRNSSVTSSVPVESISYTETSPTRQSKRLLLKKKQDIRAISRVAMLSPNEEHASFEESLVSSTSLKHSFLANGNKIQILKETVADKARQVSPSHNESKMFVIPSEEADKARQEYPSHNENKTLLKLSEDVNPPNNLPYDIESQTSKGRSLESVPKPSDKSVEIENSLINVSERRKSETLTAVDASVVQDIENSKSKIPRSSNNDSSALSGTSESHQMLNGKDDLLQNVSTNSMTQTRALSKRSNLESLQNISVANGACSQSGENVMLEHDAWVVFEEAVTSDKLVSSNDDLGSELSVVGQTKRSKFKKILDIDPAIFDGILEINSSESHVSPENAQEIQVPNIVVETEQYSLENRICSRGQEVVDQKIVSNMRINFREISDQTANSQVSICETESCIEAQLSHDEHLKPRQTNESKFSYQNVNSKSLSMQWQQARTYDERDGAHNLPCRRLCSSFQQDQGSSKYSSIRDKLLQGQDLNTSSFGNNYCNKSLPTNYKLRVPNNLIDNNRCHVPVSFEDALIDYFPNSRRIKTKNNMQKKQAKSSTDLFDDCEDYRPPRYKKLKWWTTKALYKVIFSACAKKDSYRTGYLAEEYFERIVDDVDTVIKRRKGFANIVKGIRNDLLELGLIETQFDFYNFIRSHFPYGFRKKVVPVARVFGEVYPPLESNIKLFEKLE